MKIDMKFVSKMNVEDVRVLLGQEFTPPIA